ncbi:EAL domain-containing protein [Pseudoalteromonas atlantica]|uniref:EAL domain-containing protein n=1 Tax=Pseudoalteromonas atlantica TaxID=288 RepID=UPI00373620AF
MGSIGPLFRAFLFALLFCSVELYAVSNKAIVLPVSDSQSLPAEFFKEAVKENNLADVSSFTLKRGRGYWILFDVNSTKQPINQILFIKNTLVDEIKFELLDSDFEIIKLKQHEHGAYFDSIIPHLSIKTNSGSAWAAVYLSNNATVTIEPTLIPEVEFYNSVEEHVIITAMISVILVVGLAISAAFYFLSRQVKFVSLMGYLMCMLVAFLARKGVFLLFGDPLISQYSNGLSAWFNLMAISFASLFFMQSSYANKQIVIAKTPLKSALLILCSIPLAASLLVNSFSVYFFVVSYTILIAMVGYLFWQCKETKTNYTGLFMLAWSTLLMQSFVLLSTVFTARSLHILNDGFLVFNTGVFLATLLIQDRLRVLQYDESLTHDDETGLPNKQKLLDCLQHKVTDSKPHSLVLFRPVVLLDARANFGYEYANTQIKRTMANLGQQLSAMNSLKIEANELKCHYISRLDDSTYAYVVNGQLELSQIEQFVCVTTAVFTEGISHNSSQLVNGVDIGVANYPLHASNATQLIQRSLQALSAKPLHGERWHMFDAENSNLAQYRLEVASYLKEAILHNQLSLFFQPQICLDTGHIHGAEALLRWHHPILGQVPPDEFIPIAESTGIIFELTEWVVEQSLIYQKEITAIYPEHIISINISAKDLLRKELPVLFLTLLNEYQLKASNVMLELTESATLSDGVNIKTALNDYRLIGLKIAIDDFGTGYSSLAYLSKMGFDEIKIDKQFVMNLEYSKNDRTICRATCDIAKSLGSFVIGEGIEDIQSLQILKGYGCEIGQGYYFSRPLAFTDYLNWLEQNLETTIDIDIDVYHMN